MRKAALVLILTAGLLLTGCAHSTEPPMDLLEYWIAFHKSTWPYEDWEDFLLFEFSNDTFPNEIDFAMTHGVYSPDVEKIEVILSISTANSFLSQVNGGDFVHVLLKRVGDIWVRVPQIGSVRVLVAPPTGSDRPITFAIVNSSINIPRYSPPYIIVIDGFSTGTYRMVLPNVHFETRSHNNHIWQGAVWAEFVIAE
ncbi:MAG: hypothetical protein FWC96_08150 [Oscillospiraceae bacterium]|nr:hypothetical protein [Oscillospiraceae bacterium]